MQELSTAHHPRRFARLLLAAAIATAVGAVQAEEEQKAEGFFEGDTLTLLSRNYYFNRDFRDPSASNPSYREEWAQGEMLEYKSGFTPGVIGVGIDVFGYAGFKLDSGRGRSNQSGTIIGLLPTPDSGSPEDSFGEAGAAAKLRVHETEIKYGQMRTAAPVFGTGDAFLLPETATGFHVSSNEIESLAFEAGHFTAFNDYNSTNRDSDVRPSYGSGDPGNAISFAGASYTATDNTSLMFYAAHYDETWDQYYVNLNHTIPLADKQSLAFDGNVYRTNDSGESRQGEIGNTTYSLKTSYTYDVHTFAVAYQHVHGDTPFDYIGWDSIWLANSNQFSDFNAPEEKSASLGYTLDLADLVTPGLTVEAKYTKGDNIDGTKADPLGGYAGYYGSDGEHWERDFDIKYEVQSGAAKGLAIRLRQATHRGNADQGDRGIDELRLRIEFPYELL